MLRKLILSVFFFLSVINSGLAATSPASPSLSTSTALASAGFYTLSWQGAADEYELEVADQPNFQSPHLLYRGPDQSSLLSGLSDGTRFYRVRAISNQVASSWSEPVKVEVTHHSLTRAFGFLFIGIIVFVATVLMIIRGSRAQFEAQS